MDDIKKIIEKAKTENRSALTEVESKQVLMQYGIPVVEEKIASSPNDAAKAADAFGYPVVLKGLGSKLTHKTERGLVRLNLTCPSEVIDAATSVAAAAGDDLEGFVVQPMIQASREFVAGIFNDSHFGPVVMLGLGGIFTEALGDVVFRIAPVKETQAEAMIDELRSAKLFGAFRGELPANREKIKETILGLSRLAMECPDIVEVDVNPLIVDRKGDIIAVDALIILGTRKVVGGERSPVDPKDLFKLFNPRSIAFIGASNQITKWGFRLPINTYAGEFPGEIYLVNPRLDEIAGRKVYKSLRDIPGKVDLAVVTIPASQIIRLIPELKAKGIRYMVLITSGFSETGAEGIKLEKELVKAATDAGIVFIGPNTMGISNPHAKLFTLGMASWPRPTSVTLIAQSGNLGTQIMVFTEKENIGLRSFCGSGNEAMVTIEDLLGACEVDDKTGTVVLYVESAKDGRRFLQLADRVSKKKPIIVLKGGRTEAGNVAAASHTGALASNIKVFNAACRQAGIILARHPIDLLDLAASFSSLPLPKGNRVAIITFGGGWGVVATDECAESGLTVPPLNDDIIRQIDTFLPSYWNRGNPVDLVGETDFSIPTKIIEMLAEWDGCDAIIHLGVIGRSSSFLESFARACVKVDPGRKELFSMGRKMVAEREGSFINHTIDLMEKYNKPILGVTLLNSQDEKAVVNLEGKKYSMVSFPTPERAVNALAGMVQYGQWLKREGIQK